jgi:hypothetical protein
VAGKLPPIRIAKLRRAVPAPEMPRLGLPPLKIKVAKLKPAARGVNTRRGARQCTRCQGTIRDGNWLHDENCPETVIQYNRYTVQSRGAVRGGVWPCPHQCEPTPLSMGRTHHWQCLFWKEHGLATPF